MNADTHKMLIGALAVGIFIYWLSMRPRWTGTVQAEPIGGGGGW